MECNIEISEYFYIEFKTSQFKSDKPEESNRKILRLIKQILLFSNAGFKFSHENDFLFCITVCVDIGHLHNDIKGEYLEKDLIGNMKYFPENCKKLIEYLEKGYHLSIKNDSRVNLMIDIDGIGDIYFSENSIKIGNITIEDLIIKMLRIDITEESYRNYSIENLNETKIDWFKLQLPMVEICKFVKQYTGYGLIECTDKTSDELTKIFYESGSMIDNIFNLNSEWRKNLFILTCIIMFQNENGFHNESEFQFDSLANPIILMRIANYLNDK